MYDSNDGTGNWHSGLYQEYSKQLVRAEHPEYNNSQVEAAARQEFETAAIAFFVETLETVKSLRPKAKWGFYGFPANQYLPCLGTSTAPLCGYDAPVIGDVFRAENDAIQAVFSASTGIFPSIYLPPRPAGWSEDYSNLVNAQYINSTTAEAIRLARVGGGASVVRPYAWAFYHNGTTTLSAADTSSVVSQAFQPPEGDGVIIWGDADSFKTDALDQAWLSKYGGPMMQKSMQQHCA